MPMNTKGSDKRTTPNQGVSHGNAPRSIPAIDEQARRADPTPWLSDLDSNQD
jgi:hypothetical protein